MSAFQSTQAEHHFRAGEHAPVSGVYRVLHEGHRGDHEVLVVRGEQLPSCRVCRAKVKYTLAAPVPHHSHDWDLTGPNLELLESPLKTRIKPDGA